MQTKFHETALRLLAGVDSATRLKVVCEMISPTVIPKEYCSHIRAAVESTAEGLRVKPNAPYVSAAVLALQAQGDGKTEGFKPFHESIVDLMRAHMTHTTSFEDYERFDAICLAIAETDLPHDHHVVEMVFTRFSSNQFYMPARSPNWQTAIDALGATAR